MPTSTRAPCPPVAGGGISKADSPFDEWIKEIAPSPQLRTRYGHAEERFAEFDRRYRQELRRPGGQRALRQLHATARLGPLVLRTATKAAERSGRSCWPKANTVDLST